MRGLKYFQKRLEQYLFLSVVFTSPFVWVSFLDIANLSVRIYDLSYLALILIVTFPAVRYLKHIEIKAFFLSITLLCGSQLVMAAYHSNVSLLIISIKTIFYALGAALSTLIIASLASMTLAEQRKLLVVLSAILSFLVYWFFSFDVLRDIELSFDFEGYHRILSSIFMMLPNSDLMGPEKGLSFRSSFATGISAIAFVLLVIDRSMSSNRFLIFCCISFFSIIVMSRSVWILYFVFFGLFLCIQPRRNILWLMICTGFISVLMLVFSEMADINALIDLFQMRLNQPTGRIDQFSTFFNYLEISIIDGLGKKLILESGLGMHNVYLALWVQFGLITFIFSTFIGLLIIFLSVGMFKQLWGKVYYLKFVAVIGISSGSYLFLRLLISASSESLFSVGEWIFFSIFLYCHRQLVFESMRLREGN